MFSNIHIENIFTYICITGGFPDSSVGKESASSAGDPSSIPGLGRSAKEGQAIHPRILRLSLWLSW